MSDPTARPYRPSDRDACLGLFDSNVPRHFDESERPEFGDFLAALPGPYLVLEDRDGVVRACGGWAVREDGITADLCWGMVDGAWHGRGWGRALTARRLEGIDATPGIRRVELQTSQHTVGFYTALGFEPVSIDVDGFAPGIDRIVMVRERV